MCLQQHPQSTLCQLLLKKTRATATNLIRDIAHTRLNVRVNLRRRLDKRLQHTSQQQRHVSLDRNLPSNTMVAIPYIFDIGRRFRRRFKENEPILLCKLLALLETHSSTVFQVALVTNEHNGHVRVGILTCFFQPSRQMIKCLASRDVIHQERAGSSTIVRPRD